jgi:hypothetical protein
MHGLPKQMRYQAALLPDGGFPRSSGLVPQPAFGTNRNHAAHCGTLVPAFRATQNGPETRLLPRPGPDHNAR